MVRLIRVWRRSIGGGREPERVCAIWDIAHAVAGFGWAALSVLIFSGWFVVTRFAVTREPRIADIIARRFGIGAVVLCRGSRLPPVAWCRDLVFALLWGMPFVLLVALALELSSAALAASVAPTLMPVSAGVLGFILLRERQGIARWLGYTQSLWA